MQYLAWVYGLILIVGTGGWVANIYKLITEFTSLSEVGGMEVARVIGIFLTPLGAVLGFF